MESTSSEFQSGTVLVLGVSKERVILAADSRGTRGKGDYVDSVCKIATFGNRLIFAVTGLFVDKSPVLPVRVRFDAFEQAKLSFQFVTNSPIDIPSFYGMSFTQAVAGNWWFTLASRFMEAAGIQIDSWLGIQKDGRDSMHFEGVFAGLEPEGNMNVVARKYGCKRRQPEDKSGPKGCIPFYESHAVVLKDQMTFSGFGVDDITNEFLRPSSPRSLAEVRQWEEWRRSDPDSADNEIAIRLAQLTIEHSQNKEWVGGPIDAVELRRGKGITWIQRKSHCPAD